MLAIVSYSGPVRLYTEEEAILLLQAKEVMRVHAREGAEGKAKAVRERVGSVRAARRFAMTPERSRYPS